METIETFKVVYKRFLDSNLTAREFCRIEGIGESHFFYWQRNLRKEVTKHSSVFMPVSVNNRCGNKLVISRSTEQNQPYSDLTVPKCEIIYPNGIVVRMTGITSAETVRMLISKS